jgi:purine-binding chemotaxis protein CheW
MSIPPAPPPSRHSDPLVLGKQYLEFTAGGRRYACDLLWVKEILRHPATAPVRQAPAYVAGVVHLRGQILTALDLDTRLGHPRADRGPAPRCIVFKTLAEVSRLPAPPDGFEAADPDLVGILVDGIADILPSVDSILPPPPETLSGLDAACVSGVIPGPDGLVTVLAVGALLTPPIQNLQLAA